MTRFWESTRFWALVIACVALVLKNYAILPVEVVDPLLALLGVSITVRTVDKLGEAQKKK